MPYIGNDLATQFQAFATQTITGDGSTGYTLDRAVANGKELLVYINNVKQEEGSGKAYTASGTTITFSEAVASTDSCYLVYMGSAQQTVTAPAGSIVSGQIANATLALPSGLTTAANTGIGTTSPDGALHIKGISDHGRIVLESGGTSGSNNNMFMQFHNGGGTEIAQIAIEEGASNEGQLIFKTGGTTTAMTIDKDGNVTVGDASKGGSLGQVRIINDASSNPASLALFGHNDVSDGSDFAKIQFAMQTSGTGGNVVAQITGEAEGTAENAAHLTFETATGGTLTEAMRIDSNGDLHIGSTAAASGSTRVSIHESANDDCLQIENTNGSLTERLIIMNAHRAAISSYQFLLTYSGDFADLQHNLRGDGNAYADGSWNGGGADYAEYFEWKDGNSSDEDRVGISVKLDGDKIVVSSDSDNGSDIIGVISANPSITGDSAWSKWNEKYLKDDYGRYKLDGNGERTLNPDYDKDKTYIAREDRKEWDVVGLMGKLRIKKGQKTGTNWIKMRDVSDTVEEWLVR